MVRFTRFEQLPNRHISVSISLSEKDLNNIIWELRDRGLNDDLSYRTTKEFFRVLLQIKQRAEL